MKGFMQGHFPAQDLLVLGRAQFVPSHEEGIHYSSDGSSLALLLEHPFHRSLAAAGN